MHHHHLREVLRYPQEPTPLSSCSHENGIVSSVVVVVAAAAVLVAGVVVVVGSFSSGAYSAQAPTVTIDRAFRPMVASEYHERSARRKYSFSASWPSNLRG